MGEFNYLAEETSLKNMGLEELGLSKRVLNTLRRSGFNKVSDVTQKTTKELLTVSDFGEKSLQELRKAYRRKLVTKMIIARSYTSFVGEAYTEKFESELKWINEDKPITKEEPFIKYCGTSDFLRTEEMQRQLENQINSLKGTKNASPFQWQTDPETRNILNQLKEKADRDI